ncbi:MAG: UDP-N-acetylglucosamine 2-epimerase (non-hydrolyzing) [Clostridiales Family XIII bacterium]|jgi:UDP-N-acetylglucosamine 2-epimerase|nr:UDP-N-acetylglucosamine 2-epimerase (non-hydrolyzing) [Clostridiales Family XIII bacterium]
MIGEGCVMKVMAVFGTRPEAIKMAPLVKMLKKEPGIEPVLCVTAQHREMLDQVMELFDLKPDYDLNIMKPNQSIGMITASVLQGVGEVLEKERPDLVLVHGDTTTSFAAALAAFYHMRPVGHVEAGLRTFDKYSPYPEEMNRTLTGRLADWHFAPTARNRDNLITEGVAPERIHVTGNTVIDALLQVAAKPYEFEEAPLADIDFANRRIITVTCHRRENLGENMRAIFSAIRDVADTLADVEFVYPVHLNPKVRATAAEILSGMNRIHLIEPLGYLPFVKLMSKSFMILTDSGGMQEEAPALGKPVLVVRRETERPEAIAAGTARLAGVERSAIRDAMLSVLTDAEDYRRMARAVNPYGDGKACARIVEILRDAVWEHE